jgi:hypothetical protein
MLDNSKIISGLHKISKPYDPDKITTDMPQTMRQLIEYKPDHSSAALETIRLEEFAGVYQTAAAPTILQPRKYTPPVEINNYCRYWPVANSFWKWLKKHRQTVNIDHHLSDNPWPIMVRLTAEIEKRTGYNIDILFSPYDDIDWQDDTDEIDLSRICLPLYFAGNDGDEVPLFALLENIIEYFQAADDLTVRDLPEVLAENLKEPESFIEILNEILHNKRFGLLGENWERALKFLSKYEGSSISYFEMQNEISVSDMDYVFNCCKMIHDMRDAVDPLIDEFSDREGTTTFWKNFVERIYGIKTKTHTHPQTKTKTKRGKTLCQVFA